MSDAAHATVLATSVPDNERSLANEHLPEATITDRPLSKALVDEHAEARILACMIHDPVSVSLLDGFEALDGVVTRSDGFDHLPLGWLADQGIPVYHLHDYAVPAVTEHTIGFILALLRRFPEAQATTLGQQRWERSHLTGRGMPDVTIGVLGTGRIGSRVVRALVGLGATVVGHDIDPDEDLGELEGFAYTGSYEDLLAVSDVLTVHVPSKEDTRGMVDQRAIGRLPGDALLVNTARGDIVDQTAVERALRDGHLAGYAADVMPGEPEPPDLARFAERDDVLITPHLAAYDHRTTSLRYERTAQIVQALVDGEPEQVDRYRVA